MMKPRAFAVFMHRYVGLAMAAFLIMSGLTGSIIAFNHEVDGLLNPSLYHNDSEGPVLPALQIIDRVHEQLPEAYVSFFEGEEDPHHNYSVFVQAREMTDPETGEANELPYNQLFVDPHTGEIAGKREWGAIRLDAPHLIPFLYRLHYTLHIPGVWGLLIMGIVAILWTIDCFFGFYLTLPATGPFWKKWGTAWRIKKGARGHRLNLDLHRAFSLWLWPLLFIIALSGVALNLPDHVFRPVLGLFTELSTGLGELAEERLAVEYDEPVQVSHREVMALAAPEAARLGITEAPTMIWHPRTYSTILVGYGEAHGEGLGPSWLAFDDRTGELIHTLIPGTGTVGDTIFEAQFPLHSGQIIGLPGRILVSALGLVVTMLSITGVLIWAKKRKAAKGRKRAALAAGARGFQEQTSAAE